MRNHFRRIPVSTEVLNLAILVYLKHIDAFKLDLFPAGAGSATGPLYRRAIAGNKNRVFGQANTLKVLAHRFQEFADCGTAADWRCTHWIAGRAILGESVGESLDFHLADGKKVGAHRARNLVRCNL